MFEIIFLILLLLYIFQIVLFSVGAKKRFPKINEEDLPTVSVIVAARNEENNILDCLESLDKLEYPEGKLEIIIVNDHSTDRTDEIIKQFIKNKPRFKSIVPMEEIGLVKGKARAIGNAINICTGDVIMTTDADCVVNPLWAKTLASYYKPDVAMVCGYTNQLDNTYFKAMQSIDFVYLLITAGGTMNLGYPLSCIGNNMSYRKSVYREIGGYEELPFSITEDFKVLKAIDNLKKYKIIYPIDSGSLVTSKPCSDIKTLYWQKKRWSVGGIDSDWLGYFVMGIGFLTHVLIIISFFFYSNTMLFLSLLKITSDYFFVLPVFRRLGLKLRISEFILFQLYFIIYILMIPFVLIASRKVVWKGREF